MQQLGRERLNEPTDDPRGARPWKKKLHTHFLKRLKKGNPKILRWRPNSKALNTNGHRKKKGKKNVKKKSHEETFPSRNSTLRLRKNLKTPMLGDNTKEKRVKETRQKKKKNPPQTFKRGRVEENSTTKGGKNQKLLRTQGGWVCRDEAREERERAVIRLDR